MKLRTQVGIVGAGPAGLTLAHLLRRQGIDAVVLENRSREYIEARVRAGVLEQGTVDTIDELGLGSRMHREGLHHHGVELRFHDRTHRIDLTGLTGKGVTVYGQQEMVIDLVAAAVERDMPLYFEVSDVALHAIESEQPVISFRNAKGEMCEIACDFIAGCDGFHGVCRPSVPAARMQHVEREYPFAWLGILAESRPVSAELIYAHHERGFALFSMRSPTITRLYLQCRPDEDLAQWPDERVWEELQHRLGENAPTLQVGRVLQKGVTPMRSFVASTMQHGRLFLAGDAVHIVPPTGAKGLNLAISDVRILSDALHHFYRARNAEKLDRYSAVALRRIWKAQRFSAWMTGLLHRIPNQSAFDYRLQLAELDYVAGSPAAAAALAENYVGLPFES